MTTAAERMTATPNGRPSALRLHLQPNLQATLSRRTLLDGGWWPRSTDPTTELPQLILALNGDRSRVRSVMLGPAGWDSHPPRMDIAGRVRVSWFTTASAGLLIAIRVDGDRVDLLVVPPDTDPATARAAMALAAQPANTVHAPDILTAVAAGQPPPTEPVEETSWEAEGGHL
jgi:Family of unknown function (DUF5994)